MDGIQSISQFYNSVEQLDFENIIQLIGDKALELLLCLA